MKTIILAAFIMVAATSYAKKKEKYVCVFKSIYGDTLTFRVNYTKLQKKGKQRTKKGTVYLNEDGTLTIKKTKQLYAYTGVDHSIPYYQRVIYTSRSLLAFNVVK